MIAIDPVVATLTGELAALDRLLTGLSPAQWATPTGLPGWRVTDVVAHIVGTEAMLAGESAPTGGIDVEKLPHVRNEIAAFNEQWVQALRDEPPAEMLRRFRDITARRTDTLRAMTQEEFDAPSWTPAGQGTYGRFMQIRVYDCWMHEQDIRDALGLPGGEDGPAAEASLDEASRALGYVVGKRAAAPDGSSVLIDLTGPVKRTLPIAVDGRARVVEELAGPPTATLRLSSGLFLRLCGGRPHEPGGVDLDGDTDLARRVADNLAFTI